MIQISSVIHLGLGYKIPFFESQDPSPQLDMQCHHYALSDFDGGEEKVKQTFLHAGELVARQTTAFGHQFRFETTCSTYRVYFQMLSYLVWAMAIHGCSGSNFENKRGRRFDHVWDWKPSIRGPFFWSHKCVVRYWQLPKALCIDAIQMGVGGIDSWGNKPLEEHMIGAQQEANWTFQLIPSRDLKSKASTVLCNPWHCPGMPPGYTCRGTYSGGDWRLHLLGYPTTT